MLAISTSCDAGNPICSENPVAYVIKNGADFSPGSATIPQRLGMNTQTFGWLAVTFSELAGTFGVPDRTSAELAGDSSEFVETFIERARSPGETNECFSELAGSSAWFAEGSGEIAETLLIRLSSLM